MRERALWHHSSWSAEQAGEDIAGLLADIAAKTARADKSEDVEASPEPPPEAGQAQPSATPEPSRGDGRVLSSPLARKLAEDKGVDVADISGSGPQGRVIKRDVEGLSVGRGAAAAAGGLLLPRGEERSERLSQMRKAIAKNLQVAWQAPAFMLTREIAMDSAMALRAEVNRGLAEDDSGIKISVNDLVIKACARALIDVPAMNSAFEGDSIRLYGAADIGVAVALEGGLITPVVRRAEAKTLSQIAVESRSLAIRARDKKLRPEEFQGATFSISNLGMFGIDHFTAVLNPPAAGILAVGQTRKIPVVNDDGTVGVGARMTVTLTCDHRAVDGAVGARFLQRFARYMETPSLMLA